MVVSYEELEKKEGRVRKLCGSMTLLDVCALEAVKVRSQTETRLIKAAERACMLSHLES